MIFLFRFLSRLSMPFTKSPFYPRFSFRYIYRQTPEKRKILRPMGLFCLLRFNRYVLSKAEESVISGKRKGKGTAKLKHLYGNFFIQIGDFYVSLPYCDENSFRSAQISRFCLFLSGEALPVSMGLVLTTPNVFRS